MSEKEFKEEASTEILENEAENAPEEKKEETCEEKIAKLELEIQEWKNSYTRKLAEFQNFTKRKEAEVSEMKKYASEGIISKVLDNIDNLERAEAASMETKNFEALVEGVNMILRNLKNLLNEEGVEEVEAGQGIVFNPYEHQAMMTENKEELENDVIVQVFHSFRILHSLRSYYSHNPFCVPHCIDRKDKGEIFQSRNFQILSKNYMNFPIFISVRLDKLQKYLFHVFRIIEKSHSVNNFHDI